MGMIPTKTQQYQPLDLGTVIASLKGMIRHSTYDGKTKAGNVWQVGNTVKVGFLSLRVISARAEFDGMPDIYTLESLKGDKRYEFIPHNGLTRLYV